MFRYLILFFAQVILGRDFKHEKGVVIVGEKTYHAALVEYKHLLYFYHNEQNSESMSFRKAFIENAKIFKNVNNTIKLGIFDMNMSMNTSTKLEIYYYPTLRLFIDQEQVGNFNKSQNLSEIVSWYNETIVKAGRRGLEKLKQGLLRNMSHIKVWTESQFPANSLIYCGSSDLEQEIKAIEKLNNTYFAILAIEPLLSKCREDTFLFVRRKSILEEQFVTISAKVHLSHIIKTVRSQIDKRFYGTPTAKPFLAIVVDSLVYAFASNESDSVALLRKNRILQLEKELMKVNFDHVGLIDLKNSFIRQNRVSALPPYLLLVNENGSFVKQIQSNSLNSSQMEAFTISGKSNETFYELEPKIIDLQSYLTMENRFGAFIFVKTKQSIYEKCNECVKIGTIMKVFASELFTHNGLAFPIQFVAIKEVNDQEKITVNGFPHLMVYLNQQIIYENEKPQKIKSAELMQIVKDIDMFYRLESINQASIERGLSLEALKKFEKEIMSQKNTIKQTYVEASIQQQKEDL